MSVIIKTPVANICFVKHLRWKSVRMDKCIINSGRRYRDMSFTYPKVPEEEMYQHDMISWSNLACCDRDSDYLLSAVQKGLKPCSNYTFKSEEERTLYINNECENLQYNTFESYNGPYSFWHITLCLPKSLSEIYDLNRVEQYYSRMGTDMDKIDFNFIKHVCSFPMSELIIRNERYDYMTPRCSEELIITGLLLGYPIESTRSFLG